MGSALAESTPTGISPPPRPSVWRVGIDRGGECIVPEGRRTCHPPLRPLGDYRIDDGSGRDPITLEFRQGRACPPGLATLDAVWVRYTVLACARSSGFRCSRHPLSAAPDR